MRRLVAAALGFGVAISAPMAHADTIKLATGNDYKPFTDENLPAGGMVTDIVRTAYENAGHEVEIDFRPWKRAERAVQQGEVIATFPYVKTEERLKKYAYSKPVFVTKVVPVVTPENKNSITSFEDMKGKKSCYPVGWSVGVDKIDQMFENESIDVARSRDMSGCYKMLKRGRIDFIPIEKASAIPDIKSYLGSLDEIHFDEFVAGSSILHLIFDKDGSTTASEIATFNEALAAIKEDGTYDEIVEKHLQ